MISFGLARIGRDFEVRYTPKGDAVGSLNLAFSRRSNGEKLTQWVDASLWGKRAESLAPYLKKGGLVSVTLEDTHIETYQSANGEGHKLAARIIEIELAGGNDRQERPEQVPGRTESKRPPSDYDDLDAPF